MEQESFFKNIFEGSFSESNKTVPNATLGEDYEEFIETLPVEVQEDVARYKNIFRICPIKLIKTGKFISLLSI